MNPKCFWAVLIGVMPFLLVVPRTALAGKPLNWSGQLCHRAIGWSLALDPYRSFSNLHLALVQSPPTWVYDPAELSFYKNILRNARRPTHLLIEYTTYPIAWGTAELYKYQRPTYDRFNLWRDINLLSSLAGGQREPYSVSLFLGQIIQLMYMDDDETVRYSSGGVYGWVLTTGGVEIFEDYPLKARWYRLEWKLKGGVDFAPLQHSWEIKAGYRWYGLRAIEDEFLLALNREKFIPGAWGWGLINNSRWECELHLPSAAVRQGLSYGKLALGKVFPWKKFLIGASVGLCYERRRIFTPNDGFSRDRRVQWSYLFQPILVW